MSSNSRNMTFWMALLLISCYGTSNAQWNYNGTHIFNSNSGNVGIGESNPLYKLTIRGSNDHIGIYVPSDNGGGIIQAKGDMGAWSMHLSLNPEGGNVGIGTMSPTDRLDVMGRIVSTNGSNANNRHLTFNGFYGYTWDLYGGHGGGGYFAISENQSTPFFVVGAGSGNVGIGTTNPAQKLSVAGTIESTSGGFKFPDGTIQTTAGGGGGGTSQWTTSGSNIYYNSGNAGIGTAAPTDKLDVAGRIVSTNATNSNNRHLTFNGFYGYTWDLYGGHGGGGYFAISENQGAPYLVVSASSGNVGIGTTNPGTYRLAVNGTVRVKEIVASTQGWPDFVFEESYRLTSLTDLERFIKSNKHLPGLPSAEEVDADGLRLGEMQSKLLQKIEELTLYVIDLKRKNESLEARIAHLEK